METGYLIWGIYQPALRLLLYHYLSQLFVADQNALGWGKVHTPLFISGHDSE